MESLSARNRRHIANSRYEGEPYAIGIDVQNLWNLPEPSDTVTLPPCFRCSAPSTGWFDGPAAGDLRRAECANCDYRSWKLTIGSLNAPQG